MDKIFGDQSGFHAFTADDFHVFISVFHFDIYQLIQKSGKAGALCAVQKKAELIEMIVDKIQHAKLGI